MPDTFLSAGVPHLKPEIYPCESYILVGRGQDYKEINSIRWEKCCGDD